MDEHDFLIRDDLKSVKNEDNGHAAGRFSKRRRTNIKSTAGARLHEMSKRLLFPLTGKPALQ
jgi:hypothetical protein